MHPQKFKRAFLQLVLLASIGIAVYITFISYRRREWATAASAMSVITAVIAIWSSLNLTWKQEDEKQPQIDLFIDDTSHKHAYSLIIKNNGGSPAYNVKIDWITPLYDYDDKITRFIDYDNEYDFVLLQNGLQYSRFVMGSDQFRDLVMNSNKPLIYEGIVSFTLSSKGKFVVKQPFKVSLEPFRKRLNVLNDQMDFYFENKNLAKYLKSISESLQNLNNSIESNKQNLND